MSHEDRTFIEAATASSSGHLHALGTEDQTMNVPHGLPTVRPMNEAGHPDGFWTLHFELLYDYLGVCPLRAYLRTWRGKAFLIGPAIYWTVSRCVPPKELHVLVEEESYRGFINQIIRIESASIIYGVGDNPHAELLIDRTWRIKVTSMAGFPISRFVLEEPIGVAAMYWDLDTVWASDRGRLAVQYGANVIADCMEISSCDEAMLVECFEQGIPIVMPDTDAQKLIDADGRLDTVRFIGLDGPCACGLRATGMVHLRSGHELPPTRLNPSTAVTDYNVWAHMVGCHLYGGESGEPTLDLNHMLSQAEASAGWLYSEPLDFRGRRNAVMWRKSAIVENPRANLTERYNWTQPAQDGV